jgi:hypothetical protein
MKWSKWMLIFSLMWISGCGYFKIFKIHKEMHLLFSINRTHTVCLAVDNERRHRYWRWVYLAYFLCYPSAHVISRGSKIKASRLWTEDIKPAGILSYLLQSLIRSLASWISCSFWPLSDLHLLLRALSFLAYQYSVFEVLNLTHSHARTRTHTLALLYWREDYIWLLFK